MCWGGDSTTREKQDKSLASAQVLAKFSSKAQERQLLLREQTFSYQPAATRASATTKTTLEGAGEVTGAPLTPSCVAPAGPENGGGRPGGGAHQLPPPGGLQLPAPPGRSGRAPSGRSFSAASSPQREAGARDASRGLGAPAVKKGHSPGPGAQAREQGQQWWTPRRVRVSVPSARAPPGSVRRRRRHALGLGDFHQLRASRGLSLGGAPLSLRTHPVPPPVDAPETGLS